MTMPYEDVDISHPTATYEQIAEKYSPNEPIA